jgi:hypothetical protein
MFAQADAAAQAVKAGGGNGFQQFAAGFGSVKHSAGEALKNSGGELVRSLLAGGGTGGGSSGGTGSGLNRHNQLQSFLEKPNADGTKQTFKEYKAARTEAGAKAGKEYMDNFVERITNPGKHYAPPDKE